MVMGVQYTQDHLQDLWRKINSLHMIYLEMDESPQKLQHRHKLEEYITEYLYIAPHNLKFMIPQTAEVLHRSASNKKDFSGYKAALGWNAISMYAGNLLSQPWRKEYREIKTYCGYYKHQIETNLVGAEIMFEAMGYKHVGNGILILEGPICPDRVGSVSQDSLVAYVECQILKAIWEELSNKYNVTWLEVLRLRETHFSSTKQCIAMLSNSIQNPRANNGFYASEQQYVGQLSCPTSQPNIANNGCYMTNGSSSMLRYGQNQVPVLQIGPHHHHHYGAGGSHAAQCVYNGCAPNTFNTGYLPYQQQQYTSTPSYIPVTYHHHNHPPVKHFASGLYHNPLQATSGSHVVGGNYHSYQPTGVPTAQLIELDTIDGVSSTTTSHSDVINRSSNRNYITEDGALGSLNKIGSTVSNGIHDISSKNRINRKNELKTPDKEEGSGTFESWDYVYKNLERQGYTKDLGEREDITMLYATPEPKTQRHQREMPSKRVFHQSTDDIVKLNNLSIAERASVEKLLELRERKLSDTQLSLYDNVSTGGETSANAAKISKVNLNRTAKAASLHSDNDCQRGVHQNGSSEPRIVGNNRHTMNTNSELKTLMNRPLNTNNMNANSVSGWHCGVCTFFNDSSKTICEMCNKSKHQISDSMEIGGSQCDECTLVNAKDNKVCDACGTSLHNTPTYI